MSAAWFSPANAFTDKQVNSIMNRSLLIFTVIINILMLSACKNETVLPEIAATDKTGASLEYLQDLTPQQVSSIVGFGNRQLILLEQNSGSVYRYNKQKRLPVLFTDEAVPQGKVTACQDFNHEQLNWFTLPESTDKILSEQLKQSVSIVATLCGNINAELTPDIFVLVQGARQLTLYSATQQSLHQLDNWRKITTVTAKPNGKYYLLPNFSHHSAINLQIVQQQQGKWQQLKILSPRDFITPFDYQPKDHSEIWMAYLNLDRASAKLMWNAGAKSISKLSTYFDSVNPALTANSGNQTDKIATVLYNLDPNSNNQVSQRLANIFVHWKAPEISAVAKDN